MKLLCPLTRVNKRTMATLAIVEAFIALGYWQMCGGGLIPGPLKVFNAIIHLITNDPINFFDNLFSSFTLTFKSMGIAIVIALVICYLGMIPIFKPVTKFVSQFRYVTLTGLIFLFTLLTKNGHYLKISLLIVGIVPFFVNSFLSILDQIKMEEYDLCTTLRMNKWETLLELIIVGRLDMAIIVISQNFAVAWLMITMAEGYCMSEGGLGTLLIKANKIMDLAVVFAVLCIIFVTGLVSDYLFTLFRHWAFPYSKLQVSK